MPVNTLHACSYPLHPPVLHACLHLLQSLVSFVPSCSLKPVAPTCPLLPTHALHAHHTCSCPLMPLHKLPQIAPTFAHLYPLCLLVPPTSHVVKLNIILSCTFFFRILNWNLLFRNSLVWPYIHHLNSSVRTQRSQKESIFRIICKSSWNGVQDSYYCICGASCNDK